MARQGRSNAAATEATETTGTEAEVTTSTTAEDTSTPATEAAPEFNLEPFKAAVEEARKQADAQTGEVPESALAGPNEEYRKLEGQKAKNAARNWCEEQMLASVGKLDATGARSYSEIRAGLNAGGGSSATKAPADPGLAFVQRAAAVSLAYGLVLADKPEIEGRDLDAEVQAMVTELNEQVQAFKAWSESTAEDKGDAPDVKPVVRQAFKLASGKASGRTGGGSTGGPRRDTAKHILSAFADKPVGTFMTIAEIAKHKSEEYGDDSPSQGAISARLFPSTTIEGVEPVEKDAGPEGKNPKGARKVA